MLKRRYFLALLIGTFVAAVWLLKPKKESPRSQPASALSPSAAPEAESLTYSHPYIPPKEEGFAEVKGLIAKHCLPCHAHEPTDPTWAKIGPPLGLSLEADDTVHSFALGIYERVVVNRSMPLGNKTGMTEQEREQIARWVKSFRPD